MHGGVFVCHASNDAGMAQRAVEVLEAAGVPCWIAPRDIEAGENYTQAILDALEAAPAIVLVFSSATNDSPHVARELETAVGSGTYSPDTTRAAIVKAVQDTKTNGAGGPIAFDQYGDTTNKVLTVYTVKGDDFAPVEGSTGSFQG